MFTVYSDSRSDSTMVSNLFIDEYMKNANDAQIKVYLYLLRMTGAHRTTSISDMADLFNHTEKDVVRSLRYWEQKGLLDLTFKGEDDLVSIRLCRPAAIRETPDPALRVLPFSSQSGTSLTLDRQLAAGGSTMFLMKAESPGQTAILPAIQAALQPAGQVVLQAAAGKTVPALSESSAPLKGEHLPEKKSPQISLPWRASA